jgi:hypothetical protein
MANNNSDKNLFVAEEYHPLVDFNDNNIPRDSFSVPGSFPTFSESRITFADEL